MAVKSQNGWPVLDVDQTRVWKIPGTERHLRLAKGVAGFVLVHLALWFDEEIEPLDRERTWDDWGWAVRPIRGSETVSNHASGTAMDLNAVQHPMGVPTAETFTRQQIGAIHDRLAWMRHGIRWGGDYENRPDAMHFEINRDRAAIRALAQRLHETPRGDRIEKANK